MILTIGRKQIEPDVAVLEMNGRIVLGNDAKTIEWNLAELLKENQKKVVFACRRSERHGGGYAQVDERRQVN